MPYRFDADNKLLDVDYVGDEYPEDPVSKNQIVLQNKYLAVGGGEIYPKLSTGEEFVVGQSYAQDAQGNKYFPTAELDGNEYYLVLGEEESPTFISTIASVDFFHLHKSVELDKKKYIYAQKNVNDIGAVFVDVMTSKNKKATYDRWKILKPGLPDRFEKHPTVDHVFTRDGGTNYFVFASPTTELAVDIDRKRKIHFHEKVGNAKKYFRNVGSDKFYYEKMDKIVFTHKGHNLLSSVPPFVYFERKDVNTIDPYTLTLAGVKVSLNKPTKVTDFVHKVDKTTNQIVGKELSEKRYFVFEKGELVLFDYVKTKSEMKRYYTKSDGSKQYFEWNAYNQKTDVAAPTDALDPFDDDDESSGSMFGGFRMLVIYLLMIVLAVAIYYMFYSRTSSLYNNNNNNNNPSQYFR